MGITPDAGLLGAMPGRGGPREDGGLDNSLPSGIHPGKLKTEITVSRGGSSEGGGEASKAPQQLTTSSLLQAFASMGITPDAGLAEAMQPRARETAGNFKPHEAENLPQAFSTMGITPEAGLVEAMPARGGPREGEGSTLTMEITRCTDARGLLGLVQQHGQSFNAIHVSAAWGKVAKMPGAGQRGEEGLVLQLLQVLTRAKMQEMGARAVANVALSMAMLHVIGRMVVDDELVGELQGRARETAGDFNPQHVLMLMSALAKMGITPDAGLVEAMQARGR